MFNNRINKRINDKTKSRINNRSNQKGFSLIEIIIAITLLIGLMAVLMTMVVGGVKSSKTGQHIADLKTLVSQKNSEITNNLPNELKRFAADQTLVGSINPAEPVNGYFDLLNDSGCIVQKTTFSVEPPIKVDPTEPSTKDEKSTSLRGGKLGDIGTTDGDLPTQNVVDCSKATFGSPSSSPISRYRRQWAIAKDKPFSGDITTAVIILDLQANEIVRNEVFVKIDGK